MLPSQFRAAAFATPAVTPAGTTPMPQATAQAKPTPTSEPGVPQAKDYETWPALKKAIESKDVDSIYQAFMGVQKDYSSNNITPNYKDASALSKVQTYVANEIKKQVKLAVPKFTSNWVDPDPKRNLSPADLNKLSDKNDPGQPVIKMALESLLTSPNGEKLIQLLLQNNVFLTTLPDQAGITFSRSQGTEIAHYPQDNQGNYHAPEFSIYLNPRAIQNPKELVSVLQNEFTNLIPNLVHLQKQKPKFPMTPTQQDNLINTYTLDREWNGTLVLPLQTLSTKQQGKAPEPNEYLQALGKRSAESTKRWLGQTGYQSGNALQDILTYMAVVYGDVPETAQGSKYSPAYLTDINNEGLKAVTTPQEFQFLQGMKKVLTPHIKAIRALYEASGGDLSQIPNAFTADMKTYQAKLKAYLEKQPDLKPYLALQSK